MRLVRHAQVMRALLHYRGEEDSFGVPVLADGTPGLFTRASTRWAIDKAGRLYQAAAGQLAQHTLFDPNGIAQRTGVLLGPAQTNLIGSADDQTTAAGWGASGGVTLTASQGPFAGRPMTFVNSSAANAHTRTIAFTSSGAKGFGALFKYVSGTILSTGISGIWDATTAGFRGRITVAVDGSGNITFGLASGATNLHVQRLADGVYWVSATANGVVHTNTNLYYGVNTGQTFQVYCAGATAVEAPTIAMPYSQGSADFLRFPVRFPPGALTVHSDITTLGWESRVAARIFQIGESGSNVATPRLLLYGGALGALQYNNAAGSSVSIFPAPSMPTFGQRLRTRSEIVVTGSTFAARVSRTYNAGAESTGAAGDPRASDAAWAGAPSNTILSIGCDTAGGNGGDILVHSLRVAPGNLAAYQMERLL